MNRFSKMLIALVAAVGFASLIHADPVVGKPAPDFTAKGTDGKEYKLADFKGKVVVLEWYNAACPFVRKHYDSGNMQGLQEKYGQQGVVWLDVLSSAPGKEGYMTAADAEANRAKEGSKSTASLMDSDGKIGKLYKAKTTPHMFVIDAKGMIAYMGAIDDHTSTDKADIAQSKNYVSAALDEVLAGKTVTMASTKPYGCSVKYR